MEMVPENRGLLACNHTHMHTRQVSLSLQPSWPLICGIITRQRSFYVADSEAALLVSFYLSAAASSLSLSFSSSQDRGAL